MCQLSVLCFDASHVSYVCSADEGTTSMWQIKGKSLNKQVHNRCLQKLGLDEYEKGKLSRSQPNRIPVAGFGSAL